MTAKKTALGSRMNRSETVTIRLDPKMRYLADIASRIQRRTLSSYIEWAINESFTGVKLPPAQKENLGEMAEHLWDVDDPDRFANLASRYPSLLTHEEQKLWKIIREYDPVWVGQDTEDGWWLDKSNLDHLSFVKVRERWEVFQAIARNEAPATALLEWERKNAPAPPQRSKPPAQRPVQSDNFDDFPGALQDEDDDLPF